MKKLSMSLSVLIAVAMLSISFVGCGGEDKGPTDQEIVGELAQKFMLALYTSDKALAQEVCNETGYKTFTELSGIFSLATLGLNSEMDQATLLGKLTLLEVKKFSDTKYVAVVYSELNPEKPDKYSIPCEKDKDGKWKVCVTKQAFN